MSGFCNNSEVGILIKIVETGDRLGSHVFSLQEIVCLVSTRCGPWAECAGDT